MKRKLVKAKTGQQVDYSLYNHPAAFGGGDYNQDMSRPDLNLSKYITSVPRDEANVEAEGGETVFGDLNGDGIPEHKIIKGPRHHSGGVPLSLPEDTFIFSDTRSMKIKNPDLLERFNKPTKSKKGYTPAALAKQYDIDKYRKILADPTSDDLSRTTAELMIKNYNIKLAELALVQESMKGMPQGMPHAAQPALGTLKINESDILDENLKGLNEQLTGKLEQQEQAQEQGQQMSPEAASAEQINQGPVAQPSEQRMMFGGRAEMNSPEGDEMQQLIALFIELTGSSEEEVMQVLASAESEEELNSIIIEMTQVVQQALAQSQQPQQPQQPQPQAMSPMAMYGMNMGGYDMPFYDAPEAEYGMSIDEEEDLIKAQGGITIQHDDPDLERKVFDARQSGQTVIVIDADGRRRPVTMESKTPEYDEATMGTEFGTTASAHAAATQYHLYKESLKDPVVLAKLRKETRDALGNEEFFKKKSGATNSRYSDKDALISQLDGMSDEEFMENSLLMQKRNQMLSARDIDSRLFSNSGRYFQKYSDVEAAIQNGDIKNPETGEPIRDQAEFNQVKSYLANEYGGKDNNGNLIRPNQLSLGEVSSGLGVGFNADENLALEQASYIGYDNMIKNAGSYDPDVQFALRNYVSPDASQTGTEDEYKGKISAIDARNLDADGDGTISRSEYLSNIQTFGNTSAGQKTGLMSQTLTYGDYEPEIEEEKNEQVCKCTKSDGTIVDLVPDPITGECPPCEENVNVLKEDEPAPWWLQDTIKTTGAFGDLMGIKKYMPWAPRVDLEEPDVVYADPTRELAAQAEQANIQTQAIGQFVGAQAQSARASSVQGTAAKQAADTLNKYNTANIASANQNAKDRAAIRNQEQLANQQISQNLYDQTTVANQQFDNSRLAMRNNLRNLYTNAITNRQQTQALNSLNPQYSINPADGGSLMFKQGKGSFSGQSTRVLDYGTAYKQCEDSGFSSDPAALRDCAKAKVAAAQGSQSMGSQQIQGGYNQVNANSSNAQGQQIQGQYNRQFGGPIYDDGGYVYDDGGFIYADNVFPFIF